MVLDFVFFICLQTGSSLSEAIDQYAERHDREHFVLDIEQLKSVFRLVSVGSELEALGDSVWAKP